MLKKIFNTTLSVKEGASRGVLRGIVQHDTLNEVNIRLSDGAKAFDYYGYTNIIFKVLKPDGTSHIDSEGENVVATSPEDGIVTVNLCGQATSAAGLCQSVIEIYSDGEKMTTARFNYEVFEELGVDETSVVSETDYPVLQNLMFSMENGYVTRAENAASEAEMWAKASKDVAEGDFATRAELEAVKNGAAPAGYGLGATRLPVVNYAEKDEITRAGWYMFYDAANSIEGFNAGFIECKGYNQSITKACVQEFYAAKGLYPMLKRYITEAKWSAWEWVNPPMSTNVEYRTTERYMGKPVYRKLIAIGAIGVGDGSFTHGIENIAQVIEVVGTNSYGPCINTHPYMQSFFANSLYVLWNTTAAISGTSYAMLKYTKTTDT